MLRLLRSARLRVAVFAVVLIALAAAAYSVGGPQQGDLRQTIDDAGIAGPVVYCLLYAGLTVLLFPGAVITATGGVVFGTALGTLFSVIGATVGAVLAFLIGRRLGRSQVARITGGRGEKLDAWLSRNGFLAVLYVRLLPVLPFNVINYAAGVSSVSTREYVAATAIGIVPGAFAYSALGSSLNDPTSPEFLAAVGLVVALAVGAPIVQRVLRRRGTDPEAAVETPPPVGQTPPG